MTPLPIITIRRDHLALCQGDHCAAAILGAFEFWTKGKARTGKELWIYKKQEELQHDLADLFGLNKVGAALRKLRAWGFLSARNNPQNKQDKTLQYRFEMEFVAAALNASDFNSECSEGTEIKSEALNLKSQALDIKPPALVSTPSDSVHTTVQTPEKTSEQTTGLLFQIPSGEGLKVGAVAELTPPLPDGDLPAKPIRSEAAETKDEGKAADETERARKAWETTVGLLELQLDPANFEFVRGSVFIGKNGRFQVSVPNERAKAMMEERLNREIGRILKDVWGQPAAVEYSVVASTPIPPSPLSPTNEPNDLLTAVAQARLEQAHGVELVGRALAVLAKRHGVRDPEKYVEGVIKNLKAEVI